MEEALTRGLLDTSVVIAPDVSDVPDEAAISAVTLAELHFGVHVAKDASTRKIRLRRLAEIESAFDPLPVDERVARSFGGLAVTITSRGRNPRTRAMDILIAATAHANDLILYTRNSRDFKPLQDELEIRFV